MNAPLLSPAARRRALLADQGFWGRVLRFWNVVRPAWPVPAFALMTCALLLLSSQGKEALYAVSDPADTATFWATFVVLIACSVAQYGVFLLAACGYYKSFSDRAMQSVNVRLWSAAAVGMIMPTFLLLFTVLSREHARWPFTDAPLRETLLRPLSADTDAAPAVSILVWVLLLSASIWFTNRRVRLHVSPFSAIARVSNAFRTVIYVLLGVGLAVAAFTQLSPSFARLLGPIGLTFVGMTLWAAFWTWAVIMVERLSWPPTPALAIVLALIVSTIGPLVESTLRAVGLNAANIVSFDRNRVDTMKRLNVVMPTDVATHARDWLDERVRRARATGQGSVRAIIVLAEGGGIRAAVQTAALLGALDAQDEHFFNDLYVMSGVSGGSVGMASYLAAKAERRPDIAEAAVEPLREDHLSPVLATMYFWDWPLAFAPVPTGALGANYDLHDRGSAFEASLQEAQFRRLGAPDPRTPPCVPGGGLQYRFWQNNNAMACPFIEVVQSAARERIAPIVLFNTTRTSDGDNEVVSNVRFAEDLRRLCNVIGRAPRGNAISLATAAHLSARFPLVSPPGSMRVGRDCERERTPGSGSVIRYVDGGYLDNSGALSASEAVAALEQYRLLLDRPADERAIAIEYVVIHIYTPVVVTSNVQPSNEVLPEVTAPLDAVTRARALQGLGPVINLCRQVGSVYAQNARQCDELGRRRSVPARDADAVVAGAFNRTYVLRTNTADSHAYWITAPLLVSDGSDVNDARFVPLGWVLGPRSYRYAVAQSRQLAQQHVAPLLR